VSPWRLRKTAKDGWIKDPSSRCRSPDLESSLMRTDIYEAWAVRRARKES